jgi:hypothetical protein
MGSCISLCGLSNNKNSNQYHEKIIKKEEKEEHTLSLSNHYTVHYPNHPPRKNTNLYNKTHHELCIVKDIPCFICNKTRKNDNIITETHHFFVEECMVTAIDWIKFGKKAINFYNPQTGINIGDKFNWSHVNDTPHIFVDSEYNMVVLCEEHHRSSNKGIHHVPFPDFIVQIAPKDGFVFLT